MALGFFPYIFFVNFCFIDLDHTIQPRTLKFGIDVLGVNILKAFFQISEIFVHCGVMGP